MQEALERLRPATREWVEKLDRVYVLEDHHRRLAILAGIQWDKAAKARGMYVTEGMTFRDRFNQLKPHPCVAIERDAVVTFQRLVRELCLDGVGVEDSRPPNLTHYTGSSKR